MEPNEPTVEPNGRNFFILTILFETGLGFIGIWMVWWFNLPFYARLEISAEVIGRGAVCCLPMLALFFVSVNSSWRPLVRLRKLVEGLLHGVLVDCHWIELALISMAAGLGEEILFRGALQPWFTRLTNPVLALVIVGLLFGAAHAVSKVYFVIATLIGFYLGWMSVAYDDLVAPIITHALYDFLALLYYQRVIMKPRESK